MLKTESSQQPNRYSKVSFGGMDNIVETESGSPRHTASFNDATSNRSSIGSVLNMSAIHHLASASEFKRGIDNEKHLSKFILHYDHILSQPRGNRSTESAIALLERSYKLQIDALLEEVHQLKLNQKILETKPENSSDASNNFDKNAKRKCQSLHCKMTIESKDSIISELEFQIQHLTSEISYLKSANRLQRDEIEKMSQDISGFGKLRSQLEEYQDEIVLLKQKLLMQETKNNRVNQELQHSRAQSRSFLQTSIQRASRPLSSQNQSIFYTPNSNTTKSKADLLALTRKLKVLEMNQSSSKDQMSPATTKGKSQSSWIQSRQEVQDLNSANTSFTRMISTPGTSLKTLNNYERVLLRELEISPNSADKINARLFELKKIKGFYLQEENKKLMSVLNKQGTRENSAERSVIKERILIDLHADSEKNTPKQVIKTS